MLVFGCQKQMMLMLVDPTQDSGAAQDFIMLLRMVCNLKPDFFFWNFPFNIFRGQLTSGS